mmetsp:Transcript_205/g.354  ORF Transcript_205/g.354 Transcript_205/m.354 type:complete len:313 (-) Transcript_205:206-1144(-)
MDAVHLKHLMISAQQRFRDSIALELSQLLKEGMTRKEATENLVLRLCQNSRMEKIPSCIAFQASKIAENLAISFDEAYRIVIIQREMKKLQSQGLSALAAIEMLTRRLVSPRINSKLRTLTLSRAGTVSPNSSPSLSPSHKKASRDEAKGGNFVPQETAFLSSSKKKRKKNRQQQHDFMADGNSMKIFEDQQNELLLKKKAQYLNSHQLSNRTCFHSGMSPTLFPFQSRARRRSSSRTTYVDIETSKDSSGDISYQQGRGANLNSTTAGVADSNETSRSSSPLYFKRLKISSAPPDESSQTNNASSDDSSGL